MIEQLHSKLKDERAVLVGLVTAQLTVFQVEEYLQELEFLAQTAGAKTIKIFYQKLTHPESQTYIGKGKLLEIAEFVAQNKIDLVIFDDELSGAQINTIQQLVKTKVIDRNFLILDIFAKHARTAQAKLQVELAQYQYLLPRLKGFWTHLERQGGGIGTRGPGETEIETDRRLIKSKISFLKNQLQILNKQSLTQRHTRSQFIRLSLVGYTNVGKSTIMNLLSKSTVLVENKLFATLDTTTRKVVFSGIPFLLSDTVGFIRKLPHHLIESFKTTLLEAQEADLLLHIVDVSHPNYEEQINTVNLTLHQLEISNKPTLLVLNKFDNYEKQHFDTFLNPEIKQELIENLCSKWEQNYPQSCVLISAQQKINIQQLKDMINNKLHYLYSQKYPYTTNFY